MREARPAGVRLQTGDARPDPARYEVLVAGRPSAEDLDASPRLRALVIPFTGLPPATRALLHERPRIEVFNLHHNAAPVAELAVGLLIAAARRIVPVDAALRRGDWRPRYEGTRGLLLDGARAVVVGHGAIGRRVARALVALGMAVTAVRRRPGEATTEDGVRVVGADALDAALEAAHAVVLAVPLTDATQGLFDRARLGRLARGAVLVNVARGDVVDEDALYEALASGRLGGAGLDVWWRYPERVASRSATRPSARPFEELDTVVLSPHRGGHADATERLRAAHLADLLGRLARGGDVDGRVDPEAGY